MIYNTFPVTFDKVYKQKAVGIDYITIYTYLFMPKKDPLRKP